MAADGIVFVQTPRCQDTKANGLLQPTESGESEESGVGISSVNPHLPFVSGGGELCFENTSDLCFQENAMPRRSSNAPPARNLPIRGSISTTVQPQPADVAGTEALPPQESCVAVLKLTQPNVSFDDMFTELEKFSDTLRQEFRNSIAELQAAQSAAAETQSDVLRTLTQAVFQTAGSREVSPESLERAIAEAESRLIARIGPAAAPVATSNVSTSAFSAGAASRAIEASAIEARAVKATPKPVAGHVRSWAEIRSEMMSGGELSEAPVAVIPEPAIDLPEVTQLSSDRHFRLPAQDPSLEVPATVDLDAISDSQLRDAFREREEFITTLIARIRRQQETATQQLSIEQLRQLVIELPEELAAQVRHTLKQMNDLARMGELELSLERARIARQVNQLEHSRQTIAHNSDPAVWSRSHVSAGWNRPRGHGKLYSGSNSGRSISSFVAYESADGERQ